jgi:hypothetical protein
MSAKRTRAVSRQQEQEVMEGLSDGRVQPGSGSVAGYKSDGRVFDKLRVEAKFTTGEVFKLELFELMKVAGECEGRERPVFVIDFKEKGTTRLKGRFVVLHDSDFQRMAHVAGIDS